MIRRFRSDGVQAPRFFGPFLLRSVVVGWTAVGSVVVFPAAECRPAEPPEKPNECRWTTDAIVVDGRADEAAWSRAAWLARFAAPWQAAARSAPASSARARLLWDASALYFFAEMDDADLFADIDERDGKLWLNDVFELFLKPDPKRTGYYEFEVNAAGTQLDMFLPQRTAEAYESHRTSTPFDWRTVVVRRGTLNARDDRDAGWSVEGRIPWTDLAPTGGRPEPDEVWTFALCRYDYDVRRDAPELSTTAPLTRPNFHDHERYAPLRFVGPSAAERRPFGIERLTPVASRVVGSPDPPPPFQAVQSFPKLKLESTIIARRQPNTDRLWIVAKQGKSTLSRFVDRPDADALEPLHTFDGTAFDLTFHPNFAANGYVYVGWNGESAAEGGAKTCRISRFTVDRKPPHRFDPASELRIVEWRSDGHNGCAVEFGNDGMLYVTTGDGTSDSDEWLTGQDLTTLLAKVLRLDVDRVTEADARAGRAYSVPRDNPFVDFPGARPETWAYGLRNPWRMTVDRRTGHLWVAQNGQDQYEQVYFVRRGDNYGWSVTEGSAPFYLERKRGPTPIVPPTLEHPHGEARSLTGGVVYDGEKFPELRGCYVYGDYSTGKIWAARHDGTKVTYHREIADTALQITGFLLDASGELLVCDHRPGGEGGLFRLERTPPQATTTGFPRRLSESGLFEPGRGHQPVAGLIPYAVNAPLWSDGSYKERFIALPPDGKIGYSPRRSWEFPEGTVLVKSFALETKAGDPTSRRWIETRFLTKQQREWVGYSYRWNDAQTDAELVAAAGADAAYEVVDAGAAGGRKAQAWRFPSRAECMMCHSRAANYVLGLSTAQLNCDYDYGGVRDNQLRTLLHLELFTLSPGDALREATANAALRRGAEPQEADRVLNEFRKFGPQRPTPRTSTLDPAFDLLPRLADPADAAAPLEDRARSYLHANCAHCHVPAGGGNAQFEILHWTPTRATHTVDVVPEHAKFGLGDPRIIARGAPEQSVLWRRMALRGRGQMPPIASAVVDPIGVDVVRRWIESMPRRREPTVVDPE